MITYTTGTFLGVVENNFTKDGNNRTYYQIVILDELDTLKFGLNDDMLKKVKNFVDSKNLKRMQDIKLAFNVYSRAVVNSNGYASEQVNVQLVDIDVNVTNKWL